MPPDLKNIATSYALDYGWAVFPVHGITDAGKCTCGNPSCDPKNAGKHPVPGNGVKAATKDLRGVNLLFKPGYNIGIATGELSGFWVLDIDGQAGENALAGLEAEHGQLPNTLLHYTGNGRHLFFKWPGFQIKNSVKKVGDGLDVRGDGGYIVAAPSRHFSGAEYRFANLSTPIVDAPEWLVNLARREKETVPSQYSIPAGYNDHELTSEQVVEMLSYVSPDCDYQSWVEIGMGLHSGGWALSIWDNWSRGGAKYQNGDCYKRWRGFKPGHGVGFGTVWHHASENGWSPSLLDKVELKGPHPAAAFLKKISTKTKPAAPSPVLVAKASGSLPFNPLDLSGLIGDTVRWIVGSAIRPQPELAMMNVLATLGAVFGRRYATEWDTRPNVYIVGLAGTGSGKDHSRKQIKKLLVAAGLHDFMAGDSIVSGAGMLRGLQAQPSQILHLDEFGMLLRAITDERGAAHIKAAAKALTEIFSSSSSVFHGGHYAGTDAKPIIIDHPNLCIYATSTLSTYTEALTRGALSSGELNRFIVLPASDDLPKLSRDVNDVVPPDRLVEQWAALAGHLAQGQGNLAALPGGISNVAAPKPILVRWAGVIDRIYEIGDRADDIVRGHISEGLAGVWTRYREQVLKLAMLSAMARNPIVPVMEDGDLDFGEAIVGASCEYVMSLARQHIADNKTEREVNDVLAFLRGKGWVSKSAIAKQFRGIGARQRSQMMDDLVTVQEVVEMRSEKTSGRPVVEYRLI